jgi:hypothetical protein
MAAMWKNGKEQQTEHFVLPHVWITTVRVVYEGVIAKLQA